MESVKGLYTDVNPLYITKVAGLSKSAIEVLLLAQFILINNNKYKGRVIPFDYSLVSKLAEVHSIKMSKQKYLKAVKELLDSKIFLNNCSGEITMCDFFDYISFEGLIGEE